MTKKTAAPKPTIGERLDALTGRDELAILDAFGHDVWDTYDEVFGSEEDFTPKKVSGRISRMLVFADKLHDGLPPKVAYDAVLDMTATDVNEFLQVDDEGAPPEEGEESGKGESTAD